MSSSRNHFPIHIQKALLIFDVQNQEVLPLSEGNLAQDLNRGMPFSPTLILISKISSTIPISENITLQKFRVPLSYFILTKPFLVDMNKSILLHVSI